MQPSRFDLVVWSLIAALVLSIGAVLAYGDHVGVRVVATFPTAGVETGARTRIGLTFAEPMDAASVETRFALAPAQPGRFEWPTPQEMWFIPEVALDSDQTYTVTVGAGAASQTGHTLLDDLRWDFTVRTPAIIFMSPATGARELWRLDQGASTPTQLTDTLGLIYGFDVALDGSAIAYGRYNDEGGIDLWLTDPRAQDHQLLVNCGADRCTDFAWSPDGARIAYSRERAPVAGGPAAPPRIWTVDVATGETFQLYQDNTVLGYGASWSPSGDKLALFDSGAGGIRVLELDSGQESILPSWLGMMGAWSPDGSAMLFNDLDQSSGDRQVIIYRVEFDTRDITPAFLPSEAFANYSVPVWSPDGEWIAVAVQPTVGGPGSQLWLMRPDGSDPRPIATDPAYTYGAYQWDPWSTSVVYQRFALNTPNVAPEVMRWTLDGDRTETLVVDASTPQWLP